MLIVAHVGHWSIWVLYALPVIAVLVAIAVGVVRERRGEPEDGDQGAGPGAPDG